MLAQGGTVADACRADRCYGAELLPLAQGIWWSEEGSGSTDERAGEGERPVAASGVGPDARQADHAGGLLGKLLGPARRRRCIDSTDIVQETVQQPRRAARAGRDWRAGFIQGYDENHRVPGQALPRPITRQQPGRELASSGPTTRAQDAALQIPRPGPALRFHPLRNLQHLCHPASPRLPQNHVQLSNGALRPGRVH